MLLSRLPVRAFLARAWLVEPPGHHLPKSIEVQHPSEKSREKPWMTSLQRGDLRPLGSRVRFTPKVFPGLLRRKMDRKQRLTSQFMARELLSVLKRSRCDGPAYIGDYKAAFKRSNELSKYGHCHNVGARIWWLPSRQSNAFIDQVCSRQETNHSGRSYDDKASAGKARPQ